MPYLKVPNYPYFRKAEYAEDSSLNIHYSFEQDGMSNDILYGHDENLVNELEKMSETLMKIVSTEVIGCFC